MWRQRRFGLRVDFPPDQRADEPCVTILVDGVDLIGERTSFVGWRPDQVLVPDSPFIPSRPGLRIAVYTCNCRIAGCGVAAPVIREVDGEIRWLDFRDYTGVYIGPSAGPGVRDDGDKLAVPALSFDAVQYRAELARAIADEPRRA